MDGILSVDLDYRMELSSAVIPSDQYYESEQSDYLKLINLPEAWSRVQGRYRQTVTIGIIDSGVYYYHTDLYQKCNTDLWRDFSHGGSVAGIHDDYDGHGTRVAGIIGAHSDNGNGIAGVCWDVSIVSLKVKDFDTISWSSYGISAILYAATQNIDILNISLSIRDSNLTGNTDITPLRAAISNFDGLVVVAAGNTKLEDGGGQDNDEYDIYPANYDLPNLITVGATDNNDNICDFSHYGEFNVDIFAPGENIYSTTISTDSSYNADSGTSFATPIVAGVAALMLSVNPKLHPDEIKAIIMKIGRDSITGLREYCVSGGRINAEEAVIHALTGQHRRINSTTTHCENVNCNDCQYISVIEHERYVYNAGGDNYYIKCYNCDYTYQICESPEYWNNGDSGHTVACPDGCYTFTECHSPVSYLQTSSIYTHTVFCGDCSSAYNDAHTWITISGTYRYQCTKCLLLSNQAPNIQQSLPPENPEIEDISDGTETA